MRTLFNQKNWIANFSWDFFWIHSAIWLPLLYYMFDFFSAGGLYVGSVDKIAVAIYCLHIIFPISTLLMSPIFLTDNPQIKTHKKRALIAGGLIFFLSTGSLLIFHFFSTELAVKLLYTLGLVYILWSAWHVSIQHAGILSLYRRRAGQTHSWDSRIDKFLSVFMTYFVLFMLYVRLDFPRVRALENLNTFLKPVADYSSELIYLCVFLMLIYLFRELMRKEKSGAKMLYATSLLTQLIFISLPNKAYLFTLLMYATPHQMAEVGLHFRINTLSYKKTAEKFKNRFLYFALFTAFLFALYQFINTRPFMGQFALDGTINTEHFGFLSNSLFYNAILVIFFVLTTMHFFINAVIYNMRKPEIRESMGPYLL